MKKGLRQIIKPIIKEKLLEIYKQEGSIRETAKKMKEIYNGKKLKDLVDKKHYKNSSFSGEKKIKFNKYHDVHNYLHEINSELVISNRTNNKSTTKNQKNIYNEKNQNDNIEEKEEMLDKYLKEQAGTEVDIEATTDEKSWEKIYVIKWKKTEGVYERYKIPVSFVKEVIYKYSKKGANMTQTELRQSLNLYWKAWRKIKNAFDITKDTHATPSFILKEIYKKGGIESVKKEILNTSQKSIQDNYINKYKSQYYKEIKKEWKKRLKRYWNILGFWDHCKRNTNNNTKSNSKFSYIKPKNDSGKHRTAVIGFTDPHIGKMNTNKILKRFQSTAKKAIQNKAQNIHFLFLGDLVETIVPGGMHPEQVESMDWIYGAELFKLATDTVVEMLTAVEKAGKTVSLTAIGGNHTRLTQQNWDDPSRILAKIAFENIKLKALQKGNNISVNYCDEKVGKVLIDGVQHIVSHWENRFAKKSRKHANELVWKYGCQDKPNVIWSWHLHQIWMNTVQTKDQKTFMIGCPALAWQNRYDKDNGWFSEPGIVIFNKDLNNPNRMRAKTVRLI